MSLNRRILVVALILVAPSAGAAQFTTFIPPQNKAKDSTKAAVTAQQKARADSVTAAQLTNMKTWVDSAAGVVAPNMAPDSLTRVAADTSAFRNGSPAPMTASPLPLLALLGLGALAVGGLLRANPASRRTGDGGGGA